MTKGRLEAFSDGVFAILITIMVLELKVPHGSDLEALHERLPIFLSYVLSFIYVGIYWNNHHHMLHATSRIKGSILWANQHLLFWLSLVPFCTGWLGENPSAPLPSAVYAVVLLCSGIAYLMLEMCIIAVEGKDSKLARAVGQDRKGQISAVLYAVSIGAAFVRPWLAQVVFVGVALMWLVPDKRIEATLEGDAREV